MISARVAGVPIPLASFRRSRRRFVLYKAPGILHRLDQRALVVTRRRAGFLVFDLGFCQLSGLAVLHHREQLRVITLFISRCPFRECRAPAKIDRLTTCSLERKAPNVEVAVVCR